MGSETVVAVQFLANDESSGVLLPRGEARFRSEIREGEVGLQNRR